MGILPNISTSVRNDILNNSEEGQGLTGYTKKITSRQ